MKIGQRILSGIILMWIVLGGVSMARAVENGDCMECHGDEALKRTASQGGNGSLFVDLKAFQYSVHNIYGIQCVDCHADITELDTDKDVPHGVDLAPVNCAGCHEAESSAYMEGVHQQASTKGMTIQCYACHGYHDVVSGEYLPVLERENRSCLKCHEPTKFHNWLPQKETHFAYVQCTVCHAPDTAHHIHLRFYDLAKKEFLPPETVFSALGTTVAGFLPMFNKDNKAEELSAEEFDNMVFALGRRGLHVTFHAELLSQPVPHIHQISKVAAKRSCEDCHSPGSHFFETVSLFFMDKEGKPNQFAVERKVLESYSMNNFYVPGGSRLRQLDMFGLLGVAGAGAGVMLHLLGRVATRPLRQKRRDALQKAQKNIFPKKHNG